MSSRVKNTIRYIHIYIYINIYIYYRSPRNPCAYCVIYFLDNGNSEALGLKLDIRNVNEVLKNMSETNDDLNILKNISETIEELNILKNMSKKIDELRITSAQGNLLKIMV